MLYIFNKDDNFINILTEDTGLINTWFKDYQNHIPDEPFVFYVDSKSELLHLIKEENQVAFYDRDNDLRLMRIKKLREVVTSDGGYINYNIEAVCEPSFLELYDHFIEDKRIIDGTAQEALDKALHGSRYIGEVTVDLGVATANFYWIHSIEAIFKILRAWGGALKDTIKLNDDNEITERKIWILQRLSKDNGLIVEPDYNAEQIERKTFSYPVTALWAQGASLQIEDEEEEHTGGYTRYITFEDVEWKKSKGDPVDKPLGQKWVGDPEALAKDGLLHNGVREHKFGHYSNQDCKTPEELLWAAWEELQERKLREIIHEATIYETDKKVSLGNTATIIYRGSDKPIELQSQITGLEYDILEQELVKIIVGKYIDMNENPMQTEIDELKDTINNNRNRWDQADKPIDKNKYPDIKPDKPLNVEAIGAFQTIQLYWDYDDHIYVSHYEVYGSQIANFVPDEQYLLWRGKVSAFSHEVATDEKWYYYVRAVNYHGRGSDFSNRVEASSIRVLNDDILFGEITADKLAENLDLANKLSEGTLDWINETPINTIRDTEERILTDMVNRIDSTETRIMDDVNNRVSSILDDINFLDGEITAVDEKLITFEQDVNEELGTFSRRIQETNVRIDNIDIRGANFITHLPRNWEWGFWDTRDGVPAESDHLIRLKEKYRINPNEDYVLSDHPEQSQDPGSYPKVNIFLLLWNRDGSYSRFISLNFKNEDHYVHFKTTEEETLYSLTVMPADGIVLDPDMVHETFYFKLSYGTEKSGWTPCLDDTGQLVSEVQHFVSDFQQTSQEIFASIESLQTDYNSLETSFSEFRIDVDGIRTDVLSVRRDFDDLKIGGENLLSADVVSIDGDFLSFSLVKDQIGSYKLDSNVFTLSVQSQEHLRLVKNIQIAYLDDLNRMFIENVKKEELPYVLRVREGTHEIKVLNITFEGLGGIVDYRDAKIKFEKGNKATDWSPAPEDIDSKFEATYSSIEQLSDSITQTVARIDGDLENAFTQITVIEQNYEEITLSVSELERDLTNLSPGDRNLILYSGNRNSSAAYFVERYDMSVDWELNTEYTAVIKGTVQEGSFGVWANGSSTKVAQLQYDEESGLYKATFKTPSSINSSGLSQSAYIYNTGVTSGVYRSTINWIKLVKGNKTSNDWIPAPEDMADKSGLISYINLSREGIQIHGRYIQITGQTYIQDGVIGTAAIANLAVDRFHLKYGIIDTVHIADAAITSAKIGRLAVDTAHIASAAVTNAKIASLNVDKLTGSIATFTQNSWNNITSQVRITGAGLETRSGSYRTSLLDGSAHWFYRNGVHIGRIGTSSLHEYPTLRGLNFQLSTDAYYMAWSHLEKADDPYYTIKFAWYKNAQAYDIKGFNFNDNVKIGSDYNLYVRTLSTTNYTEGNRHLQLQNYTWNGFNGVAITRSSSGASVFLAQSIAALKNRGNAYIQVGEGSNGNYVRSIDIYNYTTTATTNMVNVSNIGTLRRSTSSRRYKLLEEPIETSYAEKILGLDVKSWYDKNAVESYAAYLESGVETEEVDPIKRVPGVIAEDVHNAGLDLFVNYDEYDRPDGISQNLSLLLIPVVKKLKRETEESLSLLQLDSDYAKQKLLQIDKRLNKLEKLLEESS